MVVYDYASIVRGVKTQTVSQEQNPEQRGGKHHVSVDICPPAPAPTTTSTVLTLSTCTSTAVTAVTSDAGNERTVKEQNGLREQRDIDEPEGKDNSTSSPGKDKSSTSSPGKDKSSTSPLGKDKSSTSPLGEDELSTSPLGKDNSTSSLGKDESTSPLGKDKSSTSPLGKDKDDFVKSRNETANGNRADDGCKNPRKNEHCLGNVESRASFNGKVETTGGDRAEWRRSEENVTSPNSRFHQTTTPPSGRPPQSPSPGRKSVRRRGNRRTPSSDNLHRIPHTRENGHEANGGAAWTTSDDVHVQGAAGCLPRDTPRKGKQNKNGDSSNWGGKNKYKHHAKHFDEKAKAKEGSDMDVIGNSVSELGKEPVKTAPVPVMATETAPPTIVATPPTPQINHVNHETPSSGQTRNDDASTAPSIDENEKDSVKEKNDRNNHVPGTDPSKSTSTPEIEVKYNYKPDQWSPLNLEGKKQYDREFLLSVQDQIPSRTKPRNLPDIPDVILNESRGNEQHHKYIPKTPSHDYFTPCYVRSSVNSSTRQGSGSMNRRSSQPGGKGSRDMKPQRVIEMPVRPPLELHKAETSWIEQMKNKKKELDHKKQEVDQTTAADGDVDTEELFSKIRGILNKLTPQKFSKLVSQIQQLEINTEKRLTGVINLIFEKAIDEPYFSVPYALLCKTLAPTSVKSDQTGGKMVTFRVKLLARCQAEFEKDRADELELGTRQAEIEAAQTDEKKKELKELLEGAKAKSKRRSTGNIRFIGELFKLKMLTGNIMHQCLVKLLKAGTEEDLECLCRLFNTIGKAIDSTDEAKTLIDPYFKRMREMIDKKQCSSRIRFLMLDVIDLRKNNWVNCRATATNDPKTIDQIHKEAAAEKEREAIQEQQNRQNVNLNKPKGQQRGGMGGGQTPRMGDDGWTTVQTKQTVDMSRMRLTKQDTDNVQLGPASRPSSSWGRGSTGGSGSKTQEPAADNRAGGMGLNRFTMLDPRSRGAGRGMSTPPGRSQDMRDNRDSRDSRGRPQQTLNKRPMGHRGSQESERESALAAVRLPSNYRSISGGLPPRRGSLGGGGGGGSLGGSRGNSRENSRSRDNSLHRDQQQRSRDPSPRNQHPEQQQTTSGPKQLTRGAMAGKSKAILEEFLHINDKKEALRCISELKGQKLMNVFVEECTNCVLERSEAGRKHTAFLLRDCIILDHVSREAWLEGIQSLTEFAEDSEIDVPKIWQYLAESIGPMMEDGLVQMKHLTSICLPIMTINKRGRLAVAVLEYISHREGHGKAGSFWRKSGLKWTDFVDYQGDRLEEFIKDNQLEYTITEGGSRPDESLSFDDIQKEFASLLKRNARDEEIFDWVESHVGETRLKDPKFIRALMTEVCKSAITMSGTKHEKKKFESRGHVLQKYIDHDPLLELQSLYALQALVHQLEHPSGLLQSFFEDLNDLEILSDDAFEAWMNSDDPNELKGFAVAKKSVNPFLSTLLADDDDCDDS